MGRGLELSFPGFPVARAVSHLLTWDLQKAELGIKAYVQVVYL